MNAVRLNVEDAAPAIARAATGLPGKESDRIGLVKQTQLPLRVVAGGRVKKHPTAQQGPMEIGHQGTDIARPITLAVSAGAQLFQKPAVSRREGVPIGLIH